jgi:hypothetical protein
LVKEREARGCEERTNSLPGTVAAIVIAHTSCTAILIELQICTSHIKKDHFYKTMKLQQISIVWKDFSWVYLVNTEWLRIFFHIELCLTSNIKSQTIPSYDQHHFGFWYSIAHPSVICVRFLFLFSCCIELGLTFYYLALGVGVSALEDGLERTGTWESSKGPGWLWFISMGRGPGQYWREPKRKKKILLMPSTHPMGFCFIPSGMSSGHGDILKAL